MFFRRQRLPLAKCRPASILTWVFPACGFVFNSSTAANGTFTSPNFPGLYPRNTKCHYLFYGAENEVIYITFRYFDVDEIPPGLVYNVLCALREGATALCRKRCSRTDIAVRLWVFRNVMGLLRQHFHKRRLSVSCSVIIAVGFNYTKFFTRGQILRIKRLRKVVGRPIHQPSFEVYFARSPTSRWLAMSCRHQYGNRHN